MADGGACAGASRIGSGDCGAVLPDANAVLIAKAIQAPQASGDNDSFALSTQPGVSR